MQLDHLNVLAAFLTIAEQRSFTKAAKRLGVSRSALSHENRTIYLSIETLADKLVLISKNDNLSYSTGGSDGDSDRQQG